MDFSDNNQINLLEKYLKGDCSKEELTRLIEWARDNPEYLQTALEAYWNSIEYRGVNRDTLFQKIMAQASEIEGSNIKEEGKVIPMTRLFNGKRKWVNVVAVLAVILTGVSLWYYFKPEESNSHNGAFKVESKEQETLPGNKAILTLADGSTIVLDSANLGAISEQGGVTVIKLTDGELSYQPASENFGTQEIQYNTIATPRGGQYQLILSDGTRVWLNAESSLRYPTAFSGNERKIEMEGEGYFKIAKDASKPFVVKVGEMQVEVLGTEFNVNAYENEGMIRTTLLEGIVEINTTNNKAILKPGEQAQLQINSAELKTVKHVDMDQVVAWKNGYFSFHNASLRDIMRQLSRWYDIEIEYEGVIVARKFRGIIPREPSLEDVLKILEESNVHFKIKDGKLKVQP